MHIAHMFMYPIGLFCALIAQFGPFERSSELWQLGLHQNKKQFQWQCINHTNSKQGHVSVNSNRIPQLPWFHYIIKPKPLFGGRRGPFGLAPSFSLSM